MDVTIMRKQILPILLFCQANKGDLGSYDKWSQDEDRQKKLFYSYYSGLFCRILVLFESGVFQRNILEECCTLLQKYSWYDIQEEDLKLFSQEGSYACEVPEALLFLEGVDNVAWKDSGFDNQRDAVCFKGNKGCWTFADVRGSVHAV